MERSDISLLAEFDPALISILYCKLWMMIIMQIKSPNFVEMFLLEISAGFNSQTACGLQFMSPSGLHKLSAH